MLSGRNVTLLSPMLMVCLSLAGCAHTYGQLRIGESPLARLSSDTAVYVAVRDDGRYGARSYPGSGQMTAQVVRAAFAQHNNRVTIAGRPEIPEEALTAARRAGYSHVVLPTILHWEDRATEWPGKPDRVQVKLILLETATGATIDAIVITGKSRWATLGGDHPEDLLPEPIGTYVASLFAPTQQ
jgi:Domain of unknown function (DUF4823)